MATNKDITEKIEQKYNINLNIQTEKGQITYWELREYFTKDIKKDNLIISTDWVKGCCSNTDTECIENEFNNQLNDLIKFEKKCVCVSHKKS